MKLKIKPFETRPGGQTGFWRDWTNRLLFLEGGWGSGKTWIGARKLLAGTVYNALKQGQGGRMIRTGIDSAMIGPTYRSMADFMFPAFEEACSDAGVQQRWVSKDNWYVLPQLGCKVRARTADRADLITGWQVATAWGDEPARWKEDRVDPKNDPYVQLMGRVRGPGKIHQVYLTYTNEGDHTRVYEEAHSSSPGRARYRARTAHNPAVADFYKYQLANLPPALAEQYLEGGAAMIGGTLAYAEQWFPDVHVSSKAVVVKRRPLAMTLDFNIEPGMHAYLGHWMDDHDIFAFCHELHAPRLHVRQLVEVLGHWIGQQGGWCWPELHVYGDATGKAEWPGTGESQYDVLAQGLRTLHLDTQVVWKVPDSNPPRVDRVNAVNIALMDMAGQPHVVINPQCERLIADFERVRWDAKAKELDKKNPLLTHGSDAAGYMIHYERPVRRWVEGVGGRVTV